MTIRRAALMILFGLAVGLFEATTAAFLPAPWRWFHPLLPIIVCWVVLERPADAIVIGLSGGLAIDLFAAGSVSFSVARFFLIALGVNLAARHLLTNRSLVAAVALVLLARVTDWAWLFIPRLAEGWQVEWKVAAWDVALVCAVFVFSAFVLKRFVGIRPIGRMGPL